MRVLFASFVCLVGVGCFACLFFLYLGLPNCSPVLQHLSKRRYRHYTIRSFLGSSKSSELNLTGKVIRVLTDRKRNVAKQTTHIADVGYTKCHLVCCSTKSITKNTKPHNKCHTWFCCHHRCRNRCWQTTVCILPPPNLRDLMKVDKWSYKGVHISSSFPNFDQIFVQKH